MPRTNFRRKSSLTLLALSLAVSTTTTSASPILLLGNVPPPAAKAADNTARPLSIPFGQGTHVIQDTFIGAGFLDGFYFQDFDDPTHGRVNYVNEPTALARNLTSFDATTFTMRADSTNIVAPEARGRDSIRIASRKTYADGVVILDLAHMPQGCSTWPAFWTVTRGQWPAGGEIDIIEGVNDQGPNLSSLHTSPNCNMPTQGPNRVQKGTSTSNTCDASLNSNQGCGTLYTSQPTSFGPAFNAAGGGFYVLRRSPTSIATWFFPRSSSQVPLDIRLGLPTLDESGWGIPDAEFPTGQGCTLEGEGGVMGDHELVFDLTFCGDWAGNTYGSSGCPSNCVDFVNNNPAAFANAYWSINSLKTYV